MGRPVISMNDGALQIIGAPVRGAGDLRALVRGRHAVPVVSARTGGSGSQEHRMFYTRGLTLHSTIEYLEHALSPESLP